MVCRRNLLWSWAIVYISLKNRWSFKCRTDQRELHFGPSSPHVLPPPVTNICPFPVSSTQEVCTFFLQLHSGYLAEILASTQHFLGYICLIWWQMLESNMKYFILCWTVQKDSSFHSFLIVLTGMCMCSNKQIERCLLCKTSSSN